MPRYRLSRLIVTDDVEVTAASPEEAKAMFSKAGIVAKGTFATTLIEEVVELPFTGYREETSVDLIDAKQKT